MLRAEDFQVQPDKGSDDDFAGSRHENLTEGTEVRRSQTEDTSPCGYSDEAKRVNLREFLEKVQDKYYELRPLLLLYKPDVTSIEFREKLRFYDPSPEHIKLQTDETAKLWKELELMKVDFNKSKSREQKAIEQTEHFVQNSFSKSAQEANYYSGDFLLGPTFFCGEPICFMDIHVDNTFKQFQPSSKEEVVQLFEMVQKMFDQYKWNMQYGVKAGIVHPVEACRAGIDILKRKYPEIASKGPEGICDSTSVYIALMLQEFFWTSAKILEILEFFFFLEAPALNLLHIVLKF